MKNHKATQKPIVDLMVFTPSRAVGGWLLLFGGLLLAIPFLILVPVLQSSGPITWGLAALIVAIFFLMIDLVVYLYWAALQPRLITSPVGIEYIGSGYRLRTSWNQLTGFADISVGGIRKSSGVSANDVAFEMSGATRVSRELLPWMQVVGALMGRYIPDSNSDLNKLAAGIPLDIFDRAWTSDQSELGKIIHRYAPQVFGSPRPPGPAVLPGSFPPSLYGFVRPRRRPWSWVLLLGFVCLEIVLTYFLALLWSGDFASNTIYTDMYDVKNVSFSSGGTTVFVIGSSLQQWQWPEGKLLRSFDNIPSPSASTFSRDGRFLMVGRYDGSVTLWRTDDGTLVRTLLPERDDSLVPSITSIAFSSDNETIAIGLENGTLRVYSLSDGALQRTLVDHGDISRVGGLISYDTRSVEALSFVASSDMLVSYTSETGVQLWDTATGKSTRVGDYDFGVTNIAVSRNGDTLAIGQSNGLIDLYRLRDLVLIQTLPGHRSQVRALVFAADDNILASGGEDGTVRVWHIHSGTLIQSFRGHSDGVTAVAFSPDDRMLVSGSQDHTVRMWNLPR